MNSYSICITTFSKRFEKLKSLVTSARYISNDILIAVNGNYNETFNDEYRKNVLALCGSFNNVYPIFFPEQRGLTKLWNTLLIHSKTDWNLVLNDDISIGSNKLFDFIEQYINTHEPSLSLINHSFSHYLVNKIKLEEIKYFDERFLGFGWEDNDMHYRHFELFNKPIDNIENYDLGLGHSHDISCDENIKTIQDKYSLFNREFFSSKYQPDHTGLLANVEENRFRKVKSDEFQYPYENYFRNNKNKL
jgi:hypothetical protein